MAEQSSSTTGTISLAIVGFVLVLVILMAIAFFSGSFGGVLGGVLKNTKGATIPETPDPTDSVFMSMRGTIADLNSPSEALKDKGAQLTSLKNQIDTLFAQYTTTPLSNTADQEIITQELSAIKADVSFIQEQALKQQTDKAEEASKRLATISTRIDRVQRVISRNRIGVPAGGQLGKTVSEAISLALEGEAGKYGYDYNAQFITNNKVSCSGFVSEALRRSGIFSKSTALSTVGFEQSDKFTEVKVEGSGTLISKETIMAAAANNTLQPGDIILMKRYDGIHHTVLYIGSYAAKNLPYAIAESTELRVHKGPQINSLESRMGGSARNNRPYKIIRPNYE